MELLKNNIKNKLGLKRWSITCQRLQDFLVRNNLDTTKVKIFSTTDYRFATRNYQSLYKHFKYSEILEYHVSNRKNCYRYLYVCAIKDVRK